MASFDQPGLATDVRLVSGDIGSAVAWSANTSMRVWRSKADEAMSVPKAESDCGRDVMRRLRV